MHNPSDDLDGFLRKAVEQVKTSEPPKDLVQECVKDALTIDATATSSRRRQRLFQFAALAAMLLIGIGVGLLMSSQVNAGRAGSKSDQASLRDDLRDGVPIDVEAKSVSERLVDPGPQDFELYLEGTVKSPLLPGIIAPSPGRGEGRHAMTIINGGPSGIPVFSPSPHVRPHQHFPNLFLPKPGNKEEQEDEVQHTTDQFKHFVSNPFMLVRQDPLSTFSSDVDTASYSLVRKFLREENRLPPPDAVRIEEMINYFTYGYPQPTGEHPVSITPEVSACPWNKDHRLVRIAVQARSINSDNAPPRNLVFLVDVSGSMNVENRLPLVKKSLHLLIDQLRAKDKVSIVVYAASTGLYLDSTPGDQKDKIRAAVDQLGAGGSTNGAAGITEAYKQAHDHFIQGGTNRVILATDGDFNVGVTSEGDLVRMIEEKRSKGVYLTCLGYGMGNLKDSTIMKLANHGHGHYAYIDTLAEAKKVFVDEGMSLTTLAQDVKLQVEFNPKAVEAYRLIGYEKRIMRHEDFNDDSKHAAVLGCGHRVTVLYEIVPTGKQAEVPAADPLKYQVEAKLSDAARTGELLTVKLRYKDSQGQKSKLMEAAIKDNGGGFDKASDDFRWAAAVAAFGRILRDNPQNAAKAAGINLAGVRELAESAMGPDLKGYREEFIELVKIAEKLAK